MESALSNIRHYQSLGLKNTGASLEEVKRAYKKLSLMIHPDRNHARGAEAAFKRLTEAYSAISNPAAGAPPQTPTPAGAGAGTPRAPGSATPQGGAGAAHSTPRAGGLFDDAPSGSVSGDGTPRAGPPQPRRRRQWEKVLGLGKKRASVERD